MSKERQKARAAREHARRLEVEAAAKKREKVARRRALVPTVAMPRRRRRYGALPTGELVRLLVVYVALQALIWFFLPGLAVRISAAVLSAACFLVYVNTNRRSTTR